MHKTEDILFNPDPGLDVEITQEMVKDHGITSDEYEKIKKILGREPNLTELGIFSVMWSEHCSYKNSRKLLRLFPTEKSDKAAIGQVLVKAGEENAGVIDIGDGWGICFKIESHNHPSAVEPFEGAATGVGGIIRDIFTMGARPVLVTNSLRFGDIDSAEVRRLFRGVVHGISHYGNCIGIPNVGGDIYFDKCYSGNPLVNALCLGIVRNDQIKLGKASGIGNPVFYVGASTGRDGLGGASFASKVLTEESKADRPAVQKGDPFMEKLLLEACLEMMAINGLVVGIQDMGAAGLTCSSCETAARGNAGIEIELNKVPQREAKMNAYEILLSESQERMLVIAQKGREEELIKVFEKWDLHAVEIGRVTDGKDMVVKQGGQVVAKMNAGTLADNAPIYDREAKEPEHLKIAQAWTSENLPDLTEQTLHNALPKILSHPTIASKRWVWKQYDHMVMAGTVVTPGSDAGIIRLRLGDGLEKFIAISNDCNNRFCYLNPYRGGQIAVAECLRNLVCSGAQPLALTDNLNFGNPHNPEMFYLFQECVKGLADACKFFDVPVVGGNVSLYNETPDHAIDPTPVVSVAGLIKNEKHITTQSVKQGDEALILLGGFPHELGGSYYLNVIHDLKTGAVPIINLEAEKRLHEVLSKLISQGLVTAAHDLSEGGLLVALCEMLFSEETTFGAKIDLDSNDKNLRADELLFGESQGRVVVAVRKNDVQKVLGIVEKEKVIGQKIGNVITEPTFEISISQINKEVVWNTEELKSVWENAIPDKMDSKNVK